MKKILAAAVLAVSLLSTQAQAGNEGALIGGLVGGLIIGGMLNHHHAPRYRDPYYEESYGYEQRCWTQYSRVWNDVYEQWERVPRTVCRWVHRY